MSVAWVRAARRWWERAEARSRGHLGWRGIPRWQFDLWDEEWEGRMNLALERGDGREYPRPLDKPRKERKP